MFALLRSVSFAASFVVPRRSVGRLPSVLAAPSSIQHRGMRLGVKPNEFRIISCDPWYGAPAWRFPLETWIRDRGLFSYTAPSVA